MYQHLESDSPQCLAAWQSLDFFLSAQQILDIDILRKAEAQFFKSKGYRETESLTPVVPVQGPLRHFDPESFTVHPTHIPQVHPLPDPCDLVAPPPPYGTSVFMPAAHTTTTPLDPNALPSAIFFPLLQIVKLNVRLVLHFLFRAEARTRLPSRLRKRAAPWRPACF